MSILSRFRQVVGLIFSQAVYLVCPVSRLELRKTSPQASDVTPDIWFRFAKEYPLSVDYRPVSCPAVVGSISMESAGLQGPASVMFYSDDSTGHMCTFSQVFLQVSKGNSACSW